MDGPGWLGSSPPPLYERIWSAVQTPGGLASTPVLSPLLLTSGLPTDTLGYIWALANRTVPGALTRHELYSVLALVALAQSGYVVNNLEALLQLKEAPIPTLDLSQLPPTITIPSICHSPLNVTCFPESRHVPIQSQEGSQLRLEKASSLEVSQINGRTISQPLNSSILYEKSQQSTSGIDALNLLENKPAPLKRVVASKPITNSDNTIPAPQVKNTLNNFMFSFPVLSESPTNLKDKSEDDDALDDEFTGFQSADCLNDSILDKNSDIHNESISYQKPSSMLDTDDLSVLVVSGKNIPSAQQLWVTERDDSTNHNNYKTPQKAFNALFDRSYTHGKDSPSSISSETIFDSHKSENTFCGIEKEKLSVFEFSLPDQDNICNPLTNSSNNTDYFTNSYKSMSILLESNVPIKEDNDDDEEFCNFQNFPVSFSTVKNEADVDKVDKYEVFRTFTNFDSAHIQNETKESQSAESNYDKKNTTVEPEFEIYKITSSNSLPVEENADTSNPITFGSGKSNEYINNYTPVSFPPEFEAQIKGEDDEFSHFQKFPVSFSTQSNEIVFDNVDKYGVLRTVTYNAHEQINDYSENKKQEVIPTTHTIHHITKYACKNKEEDDILSKDAGKNYNAEGKCKVQDSELISSQLTTSGSEVDNLLSLLTLSEKGTEKDKKTVISTVVTPAEDKYKALRLLGTQDELEEFGDFLGAEITSSVDEHRSMTINEVPSIQIRCLEVCLKLLKSGLDSFSKSTPDVIDEVMSDPRANNYLDCLLEVNRVSHRIRQYLGADACPNLVTQLDSTWHNLTQFFSYSEHSHMADSEGEVCSVCYQQAGPSPVTFGAQSFHAPCANLYLHCIEPTLPNINATTAIR